MKKFQKNPGESERAAYNFNGIAFDILCVLLNNMSDDKLPNAIMDEDVRLRKGAIEKIDITQYANFIKSIKNDIDKIEFKPLRLHIHAQKAFKIIVPIHDAIMIECDDKETAQDVAQLMKDTANQLFNGEFAHVTLEEIGGVDHE